MYININDCIIETLGKRVICLIKFELGYAVQCVLFECVSVNGKSDIKPNEFKKVNMNFNFSTFVYKSLSTSPGIEALYMKKISI